MYANPLFWGKISVVDCVKKSQSTVINMQTRQPTKQRKDQVIQPDVDTVDAQGIAAETKKTEHIDSTLSNSSDSQLFAESAPTAKEQLLAAEGGYYLSDQAAKLLSISENELQKWRETDQLIGLPLKDETFVYPKWQFSENAILPDLDKVLAQFPYKSPWGRAAFMLDTWLSNGLGTPLAGLRAGKLSEVLALVNGIGEQGGL